MTNQRARTLRRNQTEAERLLWSRLRNRQLVGEKFRRQVPRGPYILDFVCLERGLVVELDGGQHGQPDQRVHDAGRAAYLELEGFRVIRFWNHEVIENLGGVLMAIEAELKDG